MIKVKVSNHCVNATLLELGKAARRWQAASVLLLSRCNVYYTHPLGVLAC